MALPFKSETDVKVVSVSDAAARNMLKMYFMTHKPSLEFITHLIDQQLAINSVEHLLNTDEIRKLSDMRLIEVEGLD